MDANSCPDEWVHQPDDVYVERFDNIGVHNVWKNQNTGEIVVQYMTITTVKENHYVESHTDSDTVERRLKKLHNLVSKKDIQSEFDSVSATVGTSVIRCRSQSKAFEAALDYMRGVSAE